jgi:hypothetical protein
MNHITSLMNGTLQASIRDFLMIMPCSVAVLRAFQRLKVTPI